MGPMYTETPYIRSFFCFSFHSKLVCNSKIRLMASSFFLVNEKTRFDLLAEIRRFVCIPKSQRIMFILIVPCKLLTSALADGFLVEYELYSKSPKISRTLLSVLVDLNSFLVWMIAARPPISNSSIAFTKPLGIVPKAPITIGITIILIFYTFF